MNGDGNVIELRPGSANPLPRKHRDYSCPGRCRLVSLDDQTERAICDDCGKEVPLFRVLSDLSMDFSKWEIARDRARAECRSAEAELADLKRQVRNVRAQLKRATRAMTETAA